MAGSPDSIETKYEQIRRFLFVGEIPSTYNKSERFNFKRYCAKFTLKDGEIYCGQRQVVKSEEEALSHFREVHTLPIGGHSGFNKTCSALSSSWFWHGMTQDVRKWIKECDMCQKVLRPRTAPQQLQCIKVSTVWEFVGLDLAGPYPTTKDGYQYIFIATDYFSKWVEAFPLKTKTAVEVSEQICNLIYQHGCPKKRFLSDQGREFVNQLNEHICNILGIQRSVLAAYHPQTNALNEETSHNIERALTKQVNDQQNDWDAYLKPTLFSLRSKVHGTTKYSPFLIIYGREAVFPSQVPVELPIICDQEDVWSRQCSEAAGEKTAEKTLRDHRIKMASAELRDELNCSICLNLYTDPVSLRCGHNFCRSCIVQVLDTQDGSGGYSCPDCRAEYPERPPLEKRRKLDDTEEHLISTQPDMEETRIFCTYCIKSPVPAVKSCLQCEISLCDDHLTVHNKKVVHILLEPTDSFNNKKCPIHKKVLEYYCPQDVSCLCVFCCLVEHIGHQVELLDEASEEKKKQLRKYLDELNPQKSEIQTRVQNLQEHRSNIQEKASDKREEISKIFIDIKAQLEMAEKKALSEISRQEDKTVSQISDLIRKLEIEENKLSRKMCHLEEMCHVTDPIRLLQESDILVCGHGECEDKGEDGGQIKSQDDTKEQDNRTDPIPLLLREAAAVKKDAPVEDFCETADLDEILILLTLKQWSVRNIMTNVTSQLGFHVPDILLDVDTAEKYIHLSEDLKTATNVLMTQNRPKKTRRSMTSSQVLSRCGLSSGRHYWEVEWNQIGRFYIGMGYPSLERKGLESHMGESWCVSLQDREFFVMDRMIVKPPDPMSPCSKFGVFLDYEAGRLSFYELCDPIRHFHTFTTSFTEPLHVILFVDDGASLKITT